MTSWSGADGGHGLDGFHEGCEEVADIGVRGTDEFLTGTVEAHPAFVENDEVVGDFECVGDLVRDMDTLFQIFNFETIDQEIGGFGSVHLYVAKKC